MAAEHGDVEAREVEQLRHLRIGQQPHQVRRLVDAVGELHQIFTVKVAGRVGGGQVPFGLGHGAGAQAQGDGGYQCELEFHGDSLIVVNKS